MEIEVTRAVLATLGGEAMRFHPEECCGLLFGLRAIDRIEPARNVHPDPERFFEIDPAALIAAHRAERRGVSRLRGYYHSHPRGLARPSATDRAMASGDGRVWAIMGTDDITFWRDGEDGFEALCLRVVEG